MSAITNTSHENPESDIATKVNILTPLPVAGPFAMLGQGLRRWRIPALLASADLLGLSVSWVVALCLRSWWGPFESQAYVVAWPLLFFFIIIFAVLRLYATVPTNPADELRRIALSCLVVHGGLAVAVFLIKNSTEWSRLVLVIAAVCACVVVPVFRALVRALFSRRSWWGHPVLIVGAGRTGSLVVTQLRRYPWLGLRPVAFLDDNLSKPSLVEGIPVLGGIELIAKVGREARIKHAIICIPVADGKRLRELDRLAADSIPHLILVPPLVGFASHWVESKDLGGVLGLEIQHRLLFWRPRFMKCLLDVFTAMFLLPPMIILGILIALWIKLDSPGPIFYTQERIGLGGKRFRVFKFRSMHGDGEARLESLLNADPKLKEEYQATHKLRNDPRITRAGRWLRRLSLDEVPQFLNFLRGEVSLVGPRAYLPREVQRIGDAAPLIWRVKPGITGLWQVSGRNQLTFEERVRLDCAYVRNWSPWLDAWILGKTTGVVLLGRGAY